MDEGFTMKDYREHQLKRVDPWFDRRNEIELGKPFSRIEIDRWMDCSNPIEFLQDRLEEVLVAYDAKCEELCQIQKKK